MGNRIRNLYVRLFVRASVKKIVMERANKIQIELLSKIATKIKITNNYMNIFTVINSFI